MHSFWDYFMRPPDVTIRFEYRFLGKASSTRGLLSTRRTTEHQAHSKIGILYVNRTLHMYCRHVGTALKDVSRYQTVGRAACYVRTLLPGG